MEAIASHAVGVEARRYGKMVRNRAVAPVKGRIEAGDLRQLGKPRPEGLDRRQVVGLVQRRERPQARKFGEHGFVDDEGYLFLTDRATFMIVSGGVNIYPQEAENLLVMHAKVADVAVFGVPNDEFGEEVKAVVQPVDWRDAGPGLEAELLEQCRSRLAAYKCPRSVDFEPLLPRDENGKLYKRRLRDRYWEGHGTRIL